MMCVFAGGASVQRGSQDWVVQSRRDGDLFDHAVAPPERCRPVRPVQRPDRHGQELSWGESYTFHKPHLSATRLPVSLSVSLWSPVCLSAGLVRGRKLFQSSEGARHRHQVLSESHPGELLLPWLQLPRSVHTVITCFTCSGMCLSPCVMISLSLCLCLCACISRYDLFVSQVDPGFAYAYTLLGHEFVLTEELDRALACFRNAIRVNNRHYNAW